MAVIATGLDYSARRLPGASVTRAGYKFVNRYLWFPGQGHPWLTADEYKDLTANGVEVHPIYEQNTNDPAGGWNAGVRMARQAVESARAAGVPAGRTVWMCSDAWLATHGISVSTAMSFLDGARSVLQPAGYLTGAYGFRDFVYAAQDGNRADRFWLCGAESGVRAGIHMYQWNNGRVYVDGLECDLNKQYLPMLSSAPGGGGGDDDMPTPEDLWNAPIKSRNFAEDNYAPPAKDWLLGADYNAGLALETARRVEVKLDSLANKITDDEANIIASIRQGGVDPAALAAALAPYLPEDGATKDEVEEALRNVLRHGTDKESA